MRFSFKIRNQSGRIWNDYAAIFKQAYNKTEAKLSTIFACPLNEPMIVREMTFNFEAFVRPTKADASSFSAQPTICRIARLIGHLAVKFASPVFVVSRTYAPSGCGYSSIIDCSSYCGVMHLAYKKEKKRSNHRLLTGCSSLISTSCLHWRKTCFRL